MSYVLKYSFLLFILSFFGCVDNISNPTEEVVFEKLNTKQTFHQVGVPATETCYNAQGKKHGPYKEWFPSGQLQVEKIFNNDELLSHKLYTQDGKVIQNIVYKNGRKYGLLFSSFCLNGVVKSSEKDSLIFTAKN